MPERKKPEPKPRRAKAADRASAGHAEVPIAGIGMSAGGLEALTRLLGEMPRDTGLAFAVVTHLDPKQETQLPAILARATRMPVKQAEDGAPIHANHVYVIPPAMTLTVADGAFRTASRAADKRIHHPVDALFASMATQRGHRSIGVVLSGSGTDGTLGLMSIKTEGGVTFAQDDSAESKSMPRSAVAAGCVDFVLSPEAIAREIAAIGQHPYVRTGGIAQATPGVLSKVVALLKTATGTDFTNYKYNTLHRRTTRRMALNKVQSIAEYVAVLERDPAELEALYNDILIGVTSFFRDPACYDALKEKILPMLTQERSRHDPLRLWVMGCSTGEEAYSLAIAITEYGEVTGRSIAAQVFATDINGSAVERARAGIYSKDIAHDVSPERLRRWFFEVDGSYRVAKQIRDACVFARHDCIGDPPFSRMDLVSCRNLVIYLEPVLQQRLLPTIHYALKPNGVLWMGNSETIGPFRDLFETLDPKHKFFMRKPAAVRATFSTGVARRDETPQPPRSAPARTVDASLEVQRDADRLLLGRYAPPSVVVSADLDILQFRGDTSPYLTPAPGRASLNLLKMVREGLLVGVRGATLKARREGRPVREEHLVVKGPDGERETCVEVLPLRGEPGREGCLLVLFDPGRPQPAAPQPERKAARRVAAATEQQIARLTQELAATREYLQSVIEQQEAANEELQSANEEVQSANEELQSINEELETSKEEIQSSNEELATVNDELQNRNLELSTTNNDLVNLLASVQMPIVMLGPNLRIRRFTPMAEKMLNLIPADVGRPISDIKLNVDIPDLGRLLADSLETITPVEREVQDRHGRWHLLRIRPYRTLDNRIDGAVMLLIDVDALKRGEEELTRQRDLLAQTREPIVVWDFDDRTIQYWSAGASEIYGWSREEALGEPVDAMLKAPDPQRFRVPLEIHGRWKGEIGLIRRDGQHITVDTSMALSAQPDGSRLVIEAARDVTERRRMEQALRDRAEQLIEADRIKNEFLAMLAHELRNPLTPLLNAAELMKIQGDAAPMEKLRDVIERQVRRMARMINDLLDVSRITQGKMELRRTVVDLRQVIRQAVEMTRPQIEARGQVLDIALGGEDFDVDADSVRIEQVFANLLDNASKFTPDGGHIRISVERESLGKADPGRPSRAIVRVRDDGMGLAPEMQSRIFDVFVQADQPKDRVHGGLGIGLTLVKRLLEMHGGSVEVFSAGFGRGSEFTIRLPIVAPRDPAATAEPGSAAAASRAPRKVLVVDDNLDAASSTADLLALRGHEVRVAHDGPSALAAADALHPQVALLDIGLPGMDGFELARRLRDLGGPRMTIVGMTGYGHQNERMKQDPGLFDEMLSKPVARDTLDAIVGRT